MPARIRHLTVLSAALLLLAAGQAPAQSYLDLQDQVQEFTLDNGVRFLVLEKHDVPVFSFRTFVNVGSANETRGITGLSHILEHMAFKGTAEIGTTDYKAELKAMQAEDAAFDAFKQVRLAIKPVLAEYELHVSRIPEDGLDDFRALEAALKDLPVEIAVAAEDGGPVGDDLFENGGKAKVTINHAMGTEQEKVDDFTV
ncbi:insulinase family protein, partial [bacterium]|nr:insulinase family protein [bacterium]